MALHSVDSSLFFSRQDIEDPRLGEWAHSTPPSEPLLRNSLQIFGWPDDEGILLNGGREGARQAPDRIRKYFYRLTPSLLFDGKPIYLWDRGNLHPQGPLVDRHETARKLIREALQQDSRVLTFGGGHDYGFADAAGFLDYQISKGHRPVVINFDAHLDVRPTNNGPHSGTSFRRLLEEFGDRFDFAEIGLQPHCNSSIHKTWAQKHGAHLWTTAEINDVESFNSKLLSWITRRLGQPLFVSLDIDVISSADAPGCSQSWALGLPPHRVHSMLETLMEHFPTQGLGIYEVSPPLDHDDRTSKLAALYAHQFLFQPQRGMHK